MEFEDVINKRASIRKFADKKPDIELAIAAIEAAHVAPTPGNLQILRYLIVEDKNIIKEIADASQQPFIEDASILVVFCSDSKQAEKMYGKRADKYIKQHAGAAIENFLLTITNLGLASCWIGAFNDFQVKRALKIPDNITIEAILPVAYEIKGSHTPQRKRTPLMGKIHYGAWNNPYRIKTTQVRRVDI